MNWLGKRPAGSDVIGNCTTISRIMPVGLERLRKPSVGSSTQSNLGMMGSKGKSGGRLGRIRVFERFGAVLPNLPKALFLQLKLVS